MFPAGTKILTANGTEKNIEDVRVGDYVLSHKLRCCRVMDFLCDWYQQGVVEVRGKHCGREVLSTQDQVFFIGSEGGGFKRSDNLCKGDVLIGLRSEPVIYDNIMTSYSGKVYHLCVGEDGSFLANGYFVKDGDEG